jgi:serine/threonine protein kinase
VKEPQISTEVSVLKCIKEANPDEVGFAKMYEYGYENEYHYLVMTILGPNLDQLLKLCGGSFSLKTTIILALQILDRLEVLHSHGFIYGDMKPNNFVVGLGADSPFVFMIDFGKCKRFKNKVTGQHIVYKENVYFSFDPIFASINTHNHIQCSRRDDIESLLYLIIYLRIGKLPWIKQNDVLLPLCRLNATRMRSMLSS